MFTRKVPPELVQAYLRAVQHGGLPDPRELCERLHVQRGSGPPVQTADLVMITNSHGDTPFLTAARHGHVELLRRLHTEFGTPLEHTNTDGKTALHEAAQGGHVECVRYLVKSGAHVDSLKRADWFVNLASTSLSPPSPPSLLLSLSLSLSLSPCCLIHHSCLPLPRSIAPGHL